MFAPPPDKKKKAESSATLASAIERYELFADPLRGEQMRLSRLNKHYEKGRGDKLFYRENGKLHEVIDCVGGFGGNLLGHRHPEIVSALAEFAMGEGVFICDQGSLRAHLGELGRRLSQMVSAFTDRGPYVVRFGSTGSEAVEMGLAHAFLEYRERFDTFIKEQKRLYGALEPQLAAEVTSRAQAVFLQQAPKVIALTGCYHGKSLGARSTLSNSSMREMFEPMMGLDRIFVSPKGDEDLDALVKRETVALPALYRDGQGKIQLGERPFSKIVAAIAEPIQGEGGIQTVNPKLLAALGNYEFPLIIDEIQAGLGRCGSLLASEGVGGNYFLFAKSLGGGVAKISCLLVERDRYLRQFDELYSSTFAGDAFSSAVAAKVLDVLEREDAPAKARDRGAAIQSRLQKVLERYPEVVKALHGRGLMQGVELNPDAVEDFYALRLAREYSKLGLLASSYFLNRQGIRILPTLSAPNVLRIEPSIYIDDLAIERIGAAFEAFCEAIRQKDLQELSGFLVQEPASSHTGEMNLPQGTTPCKPSSESSLSISGSERTKSSRVLDNLPPFSCAFEKPAPGAERVVFVNHYVIPEREMAWSNPSLVGLDDEERRALFYRLSLLLDYQPHLFFAKNMFDNQVWFASMMLAIDTEGIERLSRDPKGRIKLVERIQEALEMGSELGCNIGVLGAFTSIVTGDGLEVMAPRGMRVSTGNAFTVAVSARRILEQCKERGIDPGDKATRLGVIGATGNIGSSLCEHLIFNRQGFSRATLISRNMGKLERLQKRLNEMAHPSKFSSKLVDPEIRISTDLNDLRECDVIAVVTATSRPIIEPHHLPQDRTVLVADISVPSSMTIEARTMSNVFMMPLTATVSVPGHPEFAMASHIDAGTAFSCSAEGMILGLEPESTRGLTTVGPIQSQTVRVLDRLAEQYGFFKRFGVGGFHPRSMRKKKDRRSQRPKGLMPQIVSHHL